ncbi:putative nucleic acid-binding Zn ribbon protein [Neobacillus sp. B4I6]
MSKNYWLTTEEILEKKKRKKNLTYSFIAIGTIILSAFVTILANGI